jgi:hypothetical protein
MITQDDRTPEQKKTHRWGIVARDKFMSGRGGAEGGVSRCAWAVDANEVNPDRVENWVRSRPEMKYVNQIDLNSYRPPRGTVHFHIYVVNRSDPAARY